MRLLNCTLIIGLCWALLLPTGSAHPSESLPSPVQGTVSSPFGWRSDPLTGKTRYHSGLDISAPHGTPVFAVQPGWVVFAGNYGGYGNLIVVQHSDTLHTWYAHNAVLLKQPGDWVNTADNIALVGATGRATGPHLHFEVRIQGEATDPLAYLTSLSTQMAGMPANRALVAAPPPPPMPTVSTYAAGPNIRAMGPASATVTEAPWQVEVLNGQQLESHQFVPLP